jgi:SulP family sulfate permease
MTLGDVLGGLAGTAVALPQSMGLGITLFLAMGFDAASGALAGLTGATVLSLCSGFAGATRGMISAPNGPVTMLLTASMATVAAQGIQGDDILLALAAILLLTGLLQFLLGVSGGGQLIKFIPYPVIAGLISGIGLLMVASQLQPLMDIQADLPAPGWMAVPPLIVLVTLAGIAITPRVMPRVPAIIGGLVIGMVTYHLLAFAMPGAPPAAWLVGELPAPGFVHADFDIGRLSGLPWQLILLSALVLSLLASVDCLLTAVVADEQTGARHSTGNELAAQGIGQALTGLLGGIGGGGTKGATLVAVKTGARRWPAMVSSLTLILLLVLFRPAGAVLPISVLAGIIIYVGFSLLEWNIVYWLRNPLTRIDGVVALTVILTTLAFDLIFGVAVGIAGTLLLFVRQQSGARVIHTRATGKTYHSLLHRSEEERALLERHGDHIVYVELRGNLFFGTTDRLFSELMPDLNRPVWLILNMRRVQSLDMSGLNLFRQMLGRLDAHGGHLVYSNVRKSGHRGRQMHKLLRRLAPEAKIPKVRTFKSTDAALEYAEDALLKQLGHEPAGSGMRVDFEHNEIAMNLSEETRLALQAVMSPLRLSKKTQVYSAGDHSPAIYFILQGLVEIRLPTVVYHYKRLAKLGPGSFFGEDAFLDPAPRMATAVVSEDAELLVLERAALESLPETQQTEAKLAILSAAGQSLSRQLRWSQTELGRLERW